MDTDLRAEQPAEDGTLQPIEINTVNNITFEPMGCRSSQGPVRIPKKNIIVGSDMGPHTSTPTAEAPKVVVRVLRRQSAREDSESENELSREDHDNNSIL